MRIQTNCNKFCWIRNNPLHFKAFFLRKFIRFSGHNLPLTSWFFFSLLWSWHKTNSEAGAGHQDVNVSPIPKISGVVNNFDFFLLKQCVGRIPLGHLVCKEIQENGVPIPGFAFSASESICLRRKLCSISDFFDLPMFQVFEKKGYSLQK